jgi:hypothetical protein
LLGAGEAEWRHLEREERAARQRAERMGLKHEVAAPRKQGRPETAEMRLRMWFEQPDRSREEYDDEADNWAWNLPSVMFVDGGRAWWRESDHRFAHSSVNEYRIFPLHVGHVLEPFATMAVLHAPSDGARRLRRQFRTHR